MLYRARGDRPMADPRSVVAASVLLVTLACVCLAEPGLAQQPDSAAQAESLKTLSIEKLMNVEVTSVPKRPERLSRGASPIQGITQQAIPRSRPRRSPRGLGLAPQLQGR